MRIHAEALATLDTERIKGIRRGVEKESLRATADGSLALTPHPHALGSALTHPHITTDYSESQLELITGVHATPETCLEELMRIHQFTLRALGDELLWVSSMPCRLPADENIPIGRYGSSNVGRAKSVYRMGLAHRYGRRMQTISGIHYNWSMPGVDSAGYFGLIRNFRRHAFLLLYLFGASPAVCSSFVEGRQHDLQTLGDGTLYMPHGTSLRMGRLGYQSDAQASLAVSYNGLDGYAASLHDALTRPFPTYESVGVMNPGGEYNQLATTLLQIENEFYGVIRPKRVIFPGERPLHALRERGVEYVEVRLLDLDPFVPVGIKAPTMRLIDVFLLHCLLSDSPPDTPHEIAQIGRNQHLTAAHGRQPGLLLERGDEQVRLTDWGAEILQACEPVAQALDDAAGGTTDHMDALRGALALLEDPSLLPSARVLEALSRDFGNSFIDFGIGHSQATRTKLLSLPFSAEQQARYSQLSEQSHQEQRRIEENDSMSFESYRRQYIAPERLGLTRTAVAPSLASV
ncbi:glutamate--cysteine ligase [Ramlibacter sp. AW1]|uniref:Glutamate--cysteine ligase n=1 Tax=Ramlibacter aurantiacus TaxID=2801330 RepID=A0A937D0W3_9BURK|nr:glutamate--cysteine ligase [Ramlibacter aurantiacus]MBL0419884.1 glutamate--cysteine ligase [Ramlibacter aurantiacus]